MNRLLAIAFILFCFEIGIFLLLVPWTGLWEHNFLLDYSPALRQIILNNFFRGAVSGLGVIDCLIGLFEVSYFWKALRTVNRPTTE